MEKQILPARYLLSKLSSSETSICLKIWQQWRVYPVQVTIFNKSASCLTSLYKIVYPWGLATTRVLLICKPSEVIPIAKSEYT